jgi:zinc protease
MKRCFSFKGLFLLFVFSLVLTVSYSKAQQIPVDPKVRIGKLSNGFTYYIRENHQPENRFDIRLVVNAGSVLENDDQQGLAHFVEHMCFNGTKHYERTSWLNTCNRWA